MSSTLPGPDVPKNLVGFFCTTSIRTGEDSVSCTIVVRDDLLDSSGCIRLGAVSYAVDLATGLAMGVAVLERERWTVTTDLHVEMTVPVTAGSLRVDAEVLRAGETTAVSTFTLHDETTGTVVGGGTCTGRPFPFSFERSQLQVPVGRPLQVSQGAPAGGERIAAYLGFRADEDGSVEVDIEDWLRNPWGILHGGVTGCLLDVAAETAGSAALGRPGRVRSAMIRYLAPGRVGPARAVPHVVTVGGGTAMVHVRVRDAGAGDRLLVLGTLDVT